MKSLNTYNYCEQLYMKPISYKVTISEDDKVIKIEEDGDLKAELSFALDKNTLFLNGKDGMEVAQIELPVAMSEIRSQKYDPETKSIDLSIVQTNGEEVVFSLDVAELVNVYTAGDGIDITDNAIRIKIKEGENALLVDENGLGLNLDSVATPEDVDKIKEDIKKIEDEIGNMVEGDKSLNEKIEDLNKADENINKEIGDIKNTIGDIKNVGSDIASELDKLHAKDTEIEGKIGDLQIGDKSIAEEIELLKNTDGVLENKINNEIVDRENQVTDLTIALDNEVERARNKEEELGEKVFKLDNKLTPVVNDLGFRVNDLTSRFQAEQVKRDGIDLKHDEEIVKLHEEDNKILSKIGNLEGSDTTIATEIASLHTKDKEFDEEIRLLHAEHSKLNQVDENIFSLIGNLGAKDAKQDTEINNLKAKDEEIDNKIGALEEGGKTIADEIKDLHAKDDEIVSKLGNLEEIDTNITTEIAGLHAKDTEIEAKAEKNKESILTLNTLVGKVGNALKTEIEEEAKTREAKDAMLANGLAIEIQDRKKADKDIVNNVANDFENLIDGIKLIKDPENNLHYTLVVNGSSKGELNIPADKMLEKVEYDDVEKTLTFTWNASAQLEPTVISVKDLADTYKAGDGLVLVPSNDGKIFKIALDKSSYVKLNVNGQLELAMKVVKPENTKWKYALCDKNNLDNGKIIDFTEDYNELNNEISSKYETIKNHDNSLKLAKESIIGVEGDAKETNTIYGLRAEIKDTESRIDGKIKTASDNTLETAKNYANAQDSITLETAKNYANAEIKKVNDKLDSNVASLKEKDLALGKAISDNSTKLEILSTGLHVEKENNKYVPGGKGVFDEIYTLFHDLTYGLDEAGLNGKIKAIEDKLKEVESNVTKLLGGNEIQGSVANLIASAVRDVKSYTDTAKNEAIQESKGYIDSELVKHSEAADAKYQKVGDYVTNDGLIHKLTTEYYTSIQVDGFLNDKLSKDEAAKTYQPRPEQGKTFITEIPSEYVTENELKAKNYAEVSYVDGKTNDKLSKGSADALYQEKRSDYVTTEILNGRNFATETVLHTTETNIYNNVNNKLTGYQPKGNYLTEVPAEYVTEIELGNMNYATKAELISGYPTKTDLTEATKDMATKEFVNNGFQVKGNYVEESTLIANNYADKSYVDNSVKPLAEKSYVDNQIEINRRDLVTQTMLENKKYLSQSDLDKKNYVDVAQLNTTLRDYATKSELTNNYPTKSYVDETFSKKNETYTKSNVDGTFAKIDWVTNNFERKANTLNNENGEVNA